MNISKTQEQVLKADKKVVIIAEGRAKGATTALYFKSIASEGHSLFCGSYLKPSHMSNGFRKVLADLDIEYTMKRDFVGERSLLEGVVPPFQSGHGCCNYNMGEDLLCTCGNILGEMYLDCFEDGSVEFKDGSVDRCY